MPFMGHKLLIGVFRRRWRGPIRICSQFYPLLATASECFFSLLSDSKDSQKFWAEVGSRRRVNTYICKMKRVTSLILELVTKFTMICISSQNYTKVHQIVPSFVKFALVLYIKSTVRQWSIFTYIWGRLSASFQDV